MGKRKASKLKESCGKTGHGTMSQDTNDVKVGRKDSAENPEEEEALLEKIARLEAGVAAAEASGDREKAEKKRKKLAKLRKEGGEDALELEGILHDGQFLLVDVLSGKVYSASRGPDGELVEVGERDVITKTVTLTSDKAARKRGKRKAEEAEDQPEGTCSTEDPETISTKSKKSKKDEGKACNIITGCRAPVKRAGQPFGKWFPTATRVPGAIYDEGVSISILLFYTYVEPLWSAGRQNAAVAHSVKQGCELNLGGRLRIAREGFNGTVSGTHEGVRKFAETLKVFDPVAFANTDFKYIDNIPKSQAFKDLSVFPVTEIVHYGIGSETAPQIHKFGGTHLDAKDYHEKMKESNTVIIDVRNAYESAIGHFSPPGAELVDPCMRVSTDFPHWLSAEETKEKLFGKNVLMYCTGGIRCERASALLRQEYGNSVGDVYQLQGGIEAYLKKFPEGGFWQGKNFCFDKRTAIGAYQPKDSSEVLGKCCSCDTEWDQYLGKRRCATCPVPLLLCTTCLSNRVDKDPAKKLLLRCPLCKAEGRTVPQGPPAGKHSAVPLDY